MSVEGGTPMLFKTNQLFIIICMFCGLLWASASMADSNNGSNTCNYWFITIFNQTDTPISYDADSLVVVGPNPSGTISPSDNVQLYIGADQVTVGGVISLSDNDGHIGGIEVMGNETVAGDSCSMSAVMSLDSRSYLGTCGRTNTTGPLSDPCTCLGSSFSGAGGRAPGNSSQDAGYPAMGFTICDGLGS